MFLLQTWLSFIINLIFTYLRSLILQFIAVLREQYLRWTWSCLCLLLVSCCPLLVWCGQRLVTKLSSALCCATIWQCVLRLLRTSLLQSVRSLTAPLNASKQPSYVSVPTTGMMPGCASCSERYHYSTRTQRAAASTFRYSPWWSFLRNDVKF